MNQDDQEDRKAAHMPSLNLSALTSEPSCPEDSSEECSSSFLPRVHSASARENDDSKSDRGRSMGIAFKASVHSRGFIRLAPPSVKRSNRRPQRFPAIPPRRLSVDGEELISQMQHDTSRAFRELYNLSEQNQSGSLKGMLVQIFHVLQQATYSNDGDSKPLNGEEPAVITDPSDWDHRSGHEFFSLLAQSQRKLREMEKLKSQVETKVEMEQAVGTDLTHQLNQLDNDLNLIRFRHLENYDNIEAERLAVAQLEQEYEMLTTQELTVHRECDVLTVQVAKQETQLLDLQSKLAHLDLISRGPMRKHLEQKKLKDQESALDDVIQQTYQDNDALEAELRALDQQIESLENQRQIDMNHLQQEEREIAEAEQKRDAIELACQRTRECHTPRPSWDAIVEEAPEISTQRYRWEMRNKDKNLITSNWDGLDNARDGDTDDVNFLDYEDGEGSRSTTKLVKEILHWIERLQKHCGVNLHLNRIWHDIEEARVELNILHHQLSRVLRKHNQHRLVSALSSASLMSKKPKQEYLIALGVHEQVPKFLRHQGKIKQQQLKKVEVENIIRKVWCEKRKRELRNPLATIALEEVLFDKLYRKYGFQPLIAEWGYNLLLSLNSYAWDAEIEMFLLCLTNAISDCVYLDQEQMLQSCQSLLLSLCSSYGNESFVTERRVLLKDALVTLRTFFPLKTSNQLQAIEKAIIRDMHKMNRGGNDSILYIDDILPLNVSYPKGFFVKTLRTQHFKEIQDFYIVLISDLEQRDTNDTGRLPLSEIRDAILTIDPLADTTTIYANLVKGMGLKSRSQLKMSEVVAYKDLLKRMNTSCLMKLTLNFDPNAHINGRHRSAAASSSTVTSSNNEKDRKDHENANEK